MHKQIIWKTALSVMIYIKQHLSSFVAGSIAISIDEQDELNDRYVHVDSEWDPLVFLEHFLHKFHH